jgi:hypothetical protein
MKWIFLLNVTSSWRCLVESSPAFFKIPRHKEASGFVSVVGRSIGEWMNGEYRKRLRVSNAGRRMPYCQGLSFRAETLVLQISDTVSGGSKFSKSSEPPSPTARV